MPLTLRESVTKAVPFTTRGIANHNVVILTRGFVCATNGTSGCSIATESTLGFKANAVVAVDATKLRKILATFTPTEVTVKRNVLHLTDSEGEVKISGIVKTSMPTIPKVSPEVTSWAMSAAQTGAIKSLADAAHILNARDSLQGIHITPAWMAVVSSRMVCILWSGLAGLIDDMVTAPCDMWRKLNVADSTVTLDGNRMLVEQDGTTYWSLLAESTLSPESLDTLIAKARDQIRREGTIQIGAIDDLAQRAVACGDSPASIYRASISEDRFNLTGDSGSARLESGIDWAESANPNNLGEQNVGLAADNLSLAATTLKSIVVKGPVGMSVCGPLDPVIVWGQGSDGTLLEVLMSPSHLP
jgi:hypothetical protein